MNWKFSAYKMVQKGDAVFLHKQGDGERGIFGYGIVTGPGYVDENGDRRAPIEFELLVDPYKELLIPLRQLREILTSAEIGARSSGVRISDEAASSLLEIIGRKQNIKRQTVPSAKQFSETLSILATTGRLTDTRRRMLVCHYNEPLHEATAKRLSHLMGWKGQKANIDYSNLGSIVAAQLNWIPPEQEGMENYSVAALMTGGRPNGEFIWTMRPQLARALELQGWPELEIADADLDDDEHDHEQSVLEKKFYRSHRRIERNDAAAVMAKRNRGYVCEVCDMTFAEVYGPFGEGFIEAHHLYALSKLADGEERPYAPDDFAVLCSNCHRMIHRWHDCSDVEGFKKMVMTRKKNENSA